MKLIKFNKFSSYKMWRILPQFVLAFLVLSLSWNLSLSSSIYHYLPSIVYAFISSTLFVSFVENIAELGFIDIELVKIIKDKLSIKNILNKFKN
jgi:hypothetical protein